jgi:hypothetical protein
MSDHRGARNTMARTATAAAKTIAVHAPYR